MATATQTPVRETKTQEQQVEELSNVSAMVPLTVHLDRDAYRYVAAQLVKEEVYLFGAAQAKLLVPDKMARLINEFIKQRAKQYANQNAKRAIEHKYKSVIEQNARETLLKVHRESIALDETK